jgi:hypothetical protein
VKSIDRSHEPYLVLVPASHDASATAAANAAAHTALVGLYPAQQGALDAVAWFAAAALGGTFLGSAFSPGVIQGSHSINPLGIGGPAGAVFRVLQGSFGFVLPAGLAALVSLVLRFRRARSLERQQIKWLVYAAGLLLLGVIAGIAVEAVLGSTDLANNLQNAILSGSFVFVPVAIGIAVLKYRLYDLEVVIRKTVVLGLLAAFITVVYAGIVGGIGAIVGSKSSTTLSFVAAAALAVLFQPARDQARRVADRLVYGRRATPYEVLSEFSGRVGEAYAADDVLARMAQVLAAGTGADTAAVWLRVGGELRPAAIWPEGGLGPDRASQRRRRCAPPRGPSRGALGGDAAVRPDEPRQAEARRGLGLPGGPRASKRPADRGASCLPRAARRRAGSGAA